MVTRETSQTVNRTGRCLDCGAPITRPERGRRPLYCAPCRGERHRQQNRDVKRRKRERQSA